MPFVSIFPKAYQLALGPVNVWLIEADDGLTLIDTGYENSAPKIVAAVQALGRQPTDVRNIVLTHCHPDHVGSLAALKQITSASAWMHPADAEFVRGHTVLLGPPQPSPGLVNALLFRMFIKNVPGRTPTTEIEHEIQDGDLLPIAGGLKAIHAPGHSPGHTAFLLPRDGGILFVADACSNVFGLSYSIVYDDLAKGRRSLGKLAQLEFSAVCFSHGKMLHGGTAKKFNAKWAM